MVPITTRVTTQKKGRTKRGLGSRQQTEGGPTIEDMGKMEKTRDDWRGLAEDKPRLDRGLRHLVQEDHPSRDEKQE